MRIYKVAVYLLIGTMVMLFLGCSKETNSKPAESRIEKTSESTKSLLNVISQPEKIMQTYTILKGKDLIGKATLEIETKSNGSEEGLCQLKVHIGEVGEKTTIHYIPETWLPISSTIAIAASGRVVTIKSYYTDKKVTIEANVGVEQKIDIPVPDGPILDNGQLLIFPHVIDLDNQFPINANVMISKNGQIVPCKINLVKQSPILIDGIKYMCDEIRYSFSGIIHQAWFLKTTFPRLLRYYNPEGDIHFEADKINEWIPAFSGS